MKNIIASGLLVASGLFAVSAKANGFSGIQNFIPLIQMDFDRPHRPYPPPPPPPPGGYPPPGSQCVSGFSYVDPNRSFHGNIVTSLTNYFNLNQNCAGHHLREVIVYAAAEGGYQSVASVEINGYTAGYPQQLAQGNIQEYDFYIDQNNSQIGYQVRDLSLRFQGDEYIQRMGFILD